MIKELVQRRAEHRATEVCEDVVLVPGKRLGAGEGLRRRRNHDVDQDQQDRAHDRGLAGAAGGVLGLLIDADPGVPAPVDEDPEQHAVDQSAAAAGETEGREPVQTDVQRLRRGSARVDLDQSHDREGGQRQHLHRQQDPLGGSRELDAHVTDPCHHGDPDSRHDAHRQQRVGSAVPLDQQERVLAGDVGEGGHDDDVRDHDRPAGEPAHLRPHRTRHPGEARAAVRVGAVHVVVGRGDEEHRDERDDHHRGRVHPHAVDGDDEAERRREAVGGRHRGDGDDEVRQVADRVRLQALAARLGPRRHGGGRTLHDYLSASMLRRATVLQPPAPLGAAGTGAVPITSSSACCGRIAAILSARRCWSTVNPIAIRVTLKRIVATAFTSTGMPL